MFPRLIIIHIDGLVKKIHIKTQGWEVKMNARGLREWHFVRIFLQTIQRWLLSQWIGPVLSNRVRMSKWKNEVDNEPVKKLNFGVRRVKEWVALKVKFEIIGKIKANVCSLQYSGGCFQQSWRAQEYVKFKVDEGQKICSAKKLRSNVRSVILGVKREINEREAAPTLTYGYEHGWDTQARCYVTHVFTGYLRSQEDW